MNKTAVIGLGNTLRRDDGIGIVILEALLTHFKRDGIAYLNFGVASFDLVYRLQQYEAVLLIDGIDASLRPGQLKLVPSDGVKLDLLQAPLSSHELNLKDLFLLCKKFKIKTKIYLAGVQVKDTGYGEGLSSSLKKNKDRIIRRIRDFIDTNFGVP